MKVTIEFVKIIEAVEEEMKENEDVLDQSLIEVFN